ncbi:MAG: ATP-binding protein, partial [Blastopirellula sp. JB062]
LESESPRPTQTAPFSLASLIRRTVEMFALEAERKAIALQTEIDPRFESPLLGDELRLRQVLVNLIQNGLKFTTCGHIEIAAQVADDASDLVLASLVVRDTGPGIPAEQRQKIFQPFVQLASSPSSTQGVGLGLSISQRLVQDLGGRLTVESQVDVGSEFRFQIPLQKPSENVLPTTPSAPASPLPDSDLKILVVDDLEANQLVVQEMLSRMSLTADYVSDGQTALQALRAARYDVVLLDLELPDISGLELAAQIRQSPCGLPLELIAITAHAVESYRTQADQAGVDQFLTKPLNFDQLSCGLSQVPIAPNEAIQISAELRIKLERLFLQQAPSLLSELRQAFHQNDQRRFVFAAHRFKGLIAYLDQPQTTQLLTRLDRDDLSLTHHRTGAILQALEIAFEQLQHHLSVQLSEQV